MKRLLAAFFSLCASAGEAQAEDVWINGVCRDNGGTGKITDVLICVGSAPCSQISVSEACHQIEAGLDIYRTDIGATSAGARARLQCYKNYGEQVIRSHGDTIPGNNLDDPPVGAACAPRT